MASCIEHAFHAVTESRRKNFGGVSFTDCSNAVGMLDPGLEIADLAPVFEACHAVTRQICQPELGGKVEGIVSLKSQVVDRQHGADMMQTGGLEQKRNQAGMPVIGMHNMRRRQAGFTGADCHGGMGQVGETNGVVAKLLPAL